MIIPADGRSLSGNKPVAMFSRHCGLLIREEIYVAMAKLCQNGDYKFYILFMKKRGISCAFLIAIKGIICERE